MSAADSLSTHCNICLSVCSRSALLLPGPGNKCEQYFFYGSILLGSLQRGFAAGS